jgi:hypothetical protein
MLPAFIWSIANAWFLGCRDARKQTMIAVIAYVLISAVGAARYILNFEGMFIKTFGHDGRLVYWVIFSLQIIASLGVLRYLVGRQFSIASYRASLERGLPWGLWLIVLLALAERYLRQHIYDWGMPHISWIWLPAVLW